MKLFKIFFLLILFLIVIIIFFESVDEEKINGVTILEYHTITDTPDIDSQRYNVRPNDFNAQLDYLQDNGYNTITALEFMKWRRGKISLPKNSVMLTFDDGYEDNFKFMLPILEAHNMKAVVYVITNQINHEGYLTVEQLKDMRRRGIEIGSHTANHRALIGLTDEDIKHEIEASKQFLEWSGIFPVLSFSYPNGAYNEKIIESLKSAGYLTAVTGDAGLNDEDTNQYLLQRVNIPEPRLGLFEFKLRLLKAKIFTKLGINQHKI